MRGVAEADAVLRLLARVAKPATNETHDDVAATAHTRAPVREADAFAWRGLAGDREITVRVVDRARPLQTNQTGHAKDDSARTARFDRSAVAAGNDRLAI